MLPKKVIQKKNFKKCGGPKFYTNEIFTKYVTLGVFISGGITKQ